MNFFSEGNKLYNSQDYLRAIDCYKRAVAKKENEACSYYNAGVCFIKLKDYDNAITMIQNALSLQKDSKYYFNLGYCYALVNFNMAWALNNDDDDCEKAIKLITSKIRNK